jgi:molybdopterin molybdotransferase
MLSVEQALQALQQTLPDNKPATETVPLRAAHRRILAAAPTAKTDVPPASNSAMDGFAIAFKDLNPDGIGTLKISARQPAGQVPEKLAPGTAVRLFTGSEIPPGADTVVIQENCDYDNAQVQIKSRPEAGANVRLQGEDIERGQSLLQRGRRLSAVDIALLAAAGIDAVNVYRRLSAQLIVTGNELARPGEPLQAGQIYDSNSPMLQALLENMGFTVALKRIADNYADTVSMLLEAATADVIISTGGVSVGEEDYIGKALSTAGKTEFWKIAIKPGKPLLFGSINHTPLFGLPGNPVSALVTFCIIARPFLSALQGDEFYCLRHWPVPAGFSTDKKIARQQYLRARLVGDAGGRLFAKPLAKQGSAMLSSLSDAEVLVRIPSDTLVREGDRIDVIALNELLT